MVKALAVVFLFLSSYTFARIKPEEELLRITVKGKIGFINLKGKVVIEPQFQAVGHFVDGLAPARIGGTYGYIDKTGKFVIPDVYDYAEDFSGGYGIVYLDGRAGYYSHELHYTQTLYRNIREFEHNRAVVEKANGICGLMDTHGRLIIDTAYTDIDILENMYLAKVHIDNGFTLIKEVAFDTAGKQLFANDVTLNGPYTPPQPIKPRQEHDSKTSVYTPFSFINDYNNGKAIAINRDYSLCLIDSQRQIVASYPSFKKAPPRDCGPLFAKGSNHRLDYSCFSEIGGNVYPTSIIIADCNSGYFIVDTLGTILCQPCKGQFLFTRNPNFLVYREHPKRNNRDSLYIFDIAARTFIPLPFAFNSFQVNSEYALYGETTEKMIYINYTGRVIWEGSIDAHRNDILSINTTHKRYATYYKLDSSLKIIPDEYEYRVGQIRTSVPLSAKTSLGVSIDPRDTVAYEVTEIERSDSSQSHHIERGMAVVFTNPSSSKSIFVKTCNREIYYIMQALDKKGVWQDLEYVYFGCTSYGTSEILPQSQMIVLAPIYTGSFHTKLRLKIDAFPSRGHAKFYSNVFEGSINPAQLWRWEFNEDPNTDHD
jgi:hypothetical protein